MPFQWIGQEEHAWVAGLPIALLLVFVAGSSALETALQSFSSHWMHHRDRSGQQDVFWGAVVRIYQQYPNFFFTALTTLRVVGALLAGGWLSICTPWQGHWLPIALLWFTFAWCWLLIGHLLARSAGKRWPNPVIRWLLPVLLVIGLVCSPFLLPLSWIVAGLGHGKRTTGPFWTAEELGKVAKQAHALHLGERGIDLLRSLLDFSDTVIREVMVPRTEMVALPLHSTLPEIRGVIEDARHSRIPVYDENIDHIAGILHVKDLVGIDWQEEAALHLREWLRPTFYVPEMMKISELLRDFQRRKTHMAIVVDEYGGTIGVVTLEDILEEIVGEIQDEYDVDEKQYKVIGDSKVIADGRASLWDLAEVLGVQFPEEAEYETLAGFLMSQAGQLPETGSVMMWRHLRFTVKEANEKRIGLVEIEKRVKSDVVDLRS